MPWGFGGGYREPAPRRLTWEELLAEDFAPQPRPSPYSNIRDLVPEDRRQAQAESLFAGLAQIGAGLSSGRWDRVDPGAVAAVQDQALQRANARQESEWAAENERAAGDFARQQKEQQAKALYGMYERVAEGESPAFQAKAETAARAGSMAELEKLGAEKGPRARLRALGDDPDQYTVEQLQERLAIELDKIKQRELLAGKIEEARREAEARAEVEEASRVRQNNQGVLFPPRETPAEAAAKADAVERVRAKYNTVAGGGVKGRIGQGANGKWGWIVQPDREHPRGQFIEIDGQPTDAGGGLMRWTANGVPFVMDKNNPEAGAFEVPMFDKDAPESKAFFDRQRQGGARGGEAFDPSNPAWKPEDSLRAIESAVGRTLPPAVQAEVLKDLRAGRKPREIQAEILRDNPTWRRK